MLRLFVGITHVVSIASLTWPGVKDDEFLQRSRAEEDVVLAADCVKHQLPSLLFIGSGHSGTTSLASLMNLHPHLKYGECKEHNFFVCPDPAEDDPNPFCTHNLEEYKSSFSVPCDTKHTFDGSQTYLAMASEPGESAVRNVHSILPDAKILVVLRDPVDELFSLGHYDIRDMVSWPILKNLVERLQIWMTVFPPSRFKFIRAEDAFSDMPGVANQVFEFMGLEKMKFDDKQLKHLDGLENGGRRRSSRHASQELRRQYYQYPGVKGRKYALEQLIGMKFDWAESDLCEAPKGILNAQSPSCKEGAWRTKDQKCTPSCADGYASNVTQITCETFWSATFSCLKKEA